MRPALLRHGAPSGAAAAAATITAPALLLTLLPLPLLLLLLLARPAAAAALLPPWPSTYDVAASTLVMPCNSSGLLSTALTRAWGLVSYDWSNAKRGPAGWVQQRPMDCEERLLEQAQAAKAANPSQRVGVYRNSLKMLSWFSSVRAKLEDAAYAPWFLRFDNASAPFTNDPCDRNFDPPLCSALYHDQWGAPGYPTPGPSGDGDCAAPNCNCGSVPCGEYFLDFRRLTDTPVNGQTMLAWYLGEYMISNTTLRSGLVDFLFLDDGWDCSGPTEVAPGFAHDTGLSGADFCDIAQGYAAAQAAFAAAIVAAGGFTWQQFYNSGTAAGPIVAKDACAATLRAWCAESSPAASQAILYGFTGTQDKTNSTPTGFAQDLANVQLIRGDYAFLGYSWRGCDEPIFRPPELDLDYGVPLGLCAETAPGVFSRNFSRSTVTMDCASWTPTITFKNASSA